MFDVAKLKNEEVKEIEMPVTCVDAPKGKEPVVVIQLTNVTRREERKINAKFNQYVMTGIGSAREGLIRSDRLAYAEAIVDLCVTDSRGLFSENGQIVHHKNENFKILLGRYPTLLNWFLDAVTVKFEAEDEFQAAFRESEEKN